MASGARTAVFRQPLKQADPQRVATHGNRLELHGKEGVDGSSPSEGSSDLRSNKPGSLVRAQYRPFFGPRLRAFLG